jgi:hypothetical protein
MFPHLPKKDGFLEGSQASERLSLWHEQHAYEDDYGAWTKWQWYELFSRALRFGLAVPFHQHSILIFTYMLLLPAGYL